MHGGRGRTALAAPPPCGPPSLLQEEALRLLVTDVRYFLEANNGVVCGPEWGRHLLTRRVRYDSEEVGAAQALTWERMAPALPEQRNCGLVPATAVARDGVKALLEDPSLTVLPRESWPPHQRAGRCHHVATDREVIKEGLVRVGLCAVLDPQQLAAGPSGAIQNGWFGVGKGKYLEGRERDPDAEALRFIMNFVPLNAVSKPVLGDVEQLPYMGQWSNLQLEAWEGALCVVLRRHCLHVLCHPYPCSLVAVYVL